MNTFGERVRTARKKRGITQQQLADLVHVSKMTIRRIETGETEIKAALASAIADALMIDDEEYFNFLIGDARISGGKLSSSDLERYQSLMSAFDQLNPAGQTEAVNRVEEMTHIPKFTKGGEDHGNET